MKSVSPEFRVHLTENVMVTMRDGVRPATDIYRPAHDGHPLNDPRPVLLHRTPYNADVNRCGPLTRACMRSIVPGHHSKWSRAWTNWRTRRLPAGANIGSIVRMPYPPVWQLRLQLPERIR